MSKLYGSWYVKTVPLQIRSGWVGTEKFYLTLELKSIKSSLVNIHKV